MVNCKYAKCFIQSHVFEDFINFTNNSNNFILCYRISLKFSKKVGGYDVQKKFTTFVRILCKLCTTFFLTIPFSNTCTWTDCLFHTGFNNAILIVIVFSLNYLAV